MITHCPHCGELLEEIKRLAGCVCNADEWGDPLNLPSLCDSFKGNRDYGCDECEHDYECHKEAKS